MTTTGEATAVRPRLKGVVWERTGTELRVVYDRRAQTFLDDPDGTVETLLRLLGEGGRTYRELARELSQAGAPVSGADVAAAVVALDGQGLVENGDHLGRLSAADAERHHSTLAFFESFASLDRSREDFLRTLRDAHVLVLGTGGLNSNTVPHLAGLGVGRMTLLDRDLVEPRNFARQYLYRWSDVGARKVTRAADWVREFDPSIEVEAVEADIGGADQIGELIDRVGPHAVAAGIDSPSEVDSWVNAACVSRRVPFVRGGMWVTEGMVWSVDPGRSGCVECSERNLPDPDQTDPGTATVLAGLRLHRTGRRVNRGIGPVAGLLGGFGAFELLRYLTRFEPPAYAASPLIVDFADGCATRQYTWDRDPDCPVCGPLASAVDSGTATTEHGEEVIT